MMTDDELQELAADIGVNGLREPLVVGEVANHDGEAVDHLIDGRNRRAACKIARVEPTVRHLDGEDPVAFVLSANIHRRHMTKGQRAMAVAMIDPKPTAYKRGGAKSSVSEELSGTRVSMARTVFAFASDLADGVLSGSTKLDEAYREARRRKDDANSTAARIAELRGRYPELADKVTDDELTLAGALAEANERDAVEREAREAVLHSIGSVLRYPADFANEGNVDEISRRLDDEFLDELASRLRCKRADLPAKIDAMRAGVEHVAAILAPALRDGGESGGGGAA